MLFKNGLKRIGEHYMQYMESIEVIKETRRPGGQPVLLLLHASEQLPWFSTSYQEDLGTFQAT